MRKYYLKDEGDCFGGLVRNDFSRDDSFNGWGIGQMNLINHQSLRIEGDGGESWSCNLQFNYFFTSKRELAINLDFVRRHKGRGYLDIIELWNDPASFCAISCSGVASALPFLHCFNSTNTIPRICSEKGGRKVHCVYSFPSCHFYTFLLPYMSFLIHYQFHTIICFTCPNGSCLLRCFLIFYKVSS